MNLSILDAEAALRVRLGAPAKPPTDYVVGFSAPTGKVLDIHREANETRIWFQPPAPPKLEGVRLMDHAPMLSASIDAQAARSSFASRPVNHFRLPRHRSLSNLRADPLSASDRLTSH